MKKLKVNYKKEGLWPSKKFHEKILSHIEIGIVLKEIVFGWYKWDKDCKKISDELNLKVINKHFHLYDWWLK